MKLPTDQWLTMLQSIWMTARADGRLLGCIVNGQGAGPFVALAVEVEAGAKLSEILANHSHKLIGRFTAQPKAMQAAEKFARAWVKRSPATAAAPCACDEMPAVRTKQAARARRPAPGARLT